MKQIKIIFILSFLSCSLLTAQNKYKEWKNMSKSEREAYMLQQGQDMVTEHLSGFYCKELRHQFSAITLETENKQLRSKASPAGSKKESLRLTFISDTPPNAKGNRSSLQTSVSVDFDPNTGAMLGYTRSDGVWLPVINHQGPRPDEYYNGFLRNKDQSRYKSLVDKCIKVIQDLEVDCYRPEGNYTVTEFSYQLDGRYDSVSQYNGRDYYSVWFFYNPNTELQKTKPLEKCYAAIISLWKDTGEVWRAEFGNGKEYLFLDKPYR